MLRRVVLVVTACVVVALVIGGVIAQRLVFGGTPTVQRPSVSPTSVAPTPCATLALSSGERAFALDSQHSTAGYVAHFLAAGQSVPGAVNGVTGFVSGDFIVSASPNPTIRTLMVQVDLRTLNSGSSDRDAHVRDDTFEAAKYPYATFAATQSPVTNGTFTDSQPVTFPISGSLTLHGVTKPVTFSMTATLTGDTFTGSGTTHIHIADFGMKQPQITSVVQVTIADDITLSISFLAHATTCQSPS